MSIQTTLEHYTQIISEEILNHHSKEHAGLAVAMIFVAIFIATLCSTLGEFGFLAAIYITLKKQWRHCLPSGYWIALFSSLIICLTFLLAEHFLQARYMILSALIILAYMCVAFEKSLPQPLKSSSRNILAIFLSLFILDNHISFGSNKSHIKDSIQWLKENAKESDWVFSNDHQISYFSGRTFYWPHILAAKSSSETITDKILLGYDYSVIEIGRKENFDQTIANLEQKGLAIEATFTCSRKNKAIILSSPLAKQVRSGKKWQNLQDHLLIKPN